MGGGTNKQYPFPLLRPALQWRMYEAVVNEKIFERWTPTWESDWDEKTQTARIARTLNHVHDLNDTRERNFY